MLHLLVRLLLLRLVLVLVLVLLLVVQCGNATRPCSKGSSHFCTPRLAQLIPPLLTLEVTFVMLLLTLLVLCGQKRRGEDQVSCKESRTATLRDLPVHLRD